MCRLLGVHGGDDTRERTSSFRRSSETISLFFSGFSFDRDWTSEDASKCCTARTGRPKSRRWPCSPFVRRSVLRRCSNCRTKRACSRASTGSIWPSFPWIKGQFLQKLLKSIVERFKSFLNFQKQFQTIFSDSKYITGSLKVNNNKN